MKTGRKQLVAAEVVESNVPENGIQARLAAADLTAALQPMLQAFGDIRDLFGQAKAARLSSAVSDVLAAKAFLQARELWKNNDLAHIASLTHGKSVSSFDELCQLCFGVGERRLRQLSATYHTLGEDLYETAQQVGFKARDYQVLNALPNDAQEAVKQALASDDKDSAVQMVYDLAQQLGTAKAQLVEAEKAAAAKDRVIEKKNKKLDELQEADEARRAAPLPEQEQLALDELRTSTLAAEGALAYMLATVDRVMAQPPTEAAEKAARHSLDYLVQRIVDGCMERGIAVDLAERVSPIWLAPITDAVNQYQAGKATKKGR